MKHCLGLALLIAGSWPQAGWAQFSRKFQAGAYELATAPAGHQEGQLSLRNHDKLVVKTPQGRKLRLKPAQVRSFRIGARRYLAFTTVYPYHSQPAHNDDEPAFVEQLDSGRVMLLRYDQVGNTGIDWLFLYRYHDQYYFLTNRQSFTDTQRYNRATRPPMVLSGYADSTVTMLPVGHRPAEPTGFRKSVLPFLAARPDLARMLETGQLTLQNLPAAIHALNYNLPYLPPASRNSTPK
jgi:hypothetical protein